MEQQIEFNLTEEDLFAYYCDAYRPTSRRRKQHWLIICFVVLIPLLLAGPSVVQGNKLDRLQYMTLLAAGVLLITLPLYWRIKPNKDAQRFISSLGGTRLQLCGLERIVIDPQRILFEHSSIGGWATWDMISSIRETPNHFFITIVNDSAAIIPASAFTSRDEFVKFKEQVKSYRQAQPSYELTCPKCGYDLSGSTSAGCSECGWGREAEA